MSRVTKVDPSDYVSIVGSTFAKHEHAPVLKLGPHTWDRWQLGRLGCPHPKAATALNRVVADLGLTTFAGLAKHAHVIGAYKGLGVTAYWTVLAILREAGYAIEAVHGDGPTYLTLKRHATKVAAKQRRRSRHARRAVPPSESTGAATSAP